MVPKWYSALFNSPMHIPNQLRDTAPRCQVHWRDLSQHHDARTAMTPRRYRKKTVDSIPWNGDEPATWIGLPMRCTLEVPLALRPDRRDNQIRFRTIATACPRASALTKLQFLFRLRCPRRLRFSNDKNGKPSRPESVVSRQVMCASFDPPQQSDQPAQRKEFLFLFFAQNIHHRRVNYGKVTVVVYIPAGPFQASTDGRDCVSAKGFHRQYAYCCFFRSSRLGGLVDFRAIKRIRSLKRAVPANVIDFATSQLSSSASAMTSHSLPILTVVLRIVSRINAKRSQRGGGECTSGWLSKVFCIPRSQLRRRFFAWSVSWRT